MNVEEIAEALVARSQTVSVAEADTCGLIGYTFSTVAGSSRWFPGGVIAYTGGLKQKVLGVSDELYETKGGQLNMNVELIAEALVEWSQTVWLPSLDRLHVQHGAGQSRWFPGGVIAYTGGLKQKVLGVSDELYETKGMATGARDLTGTDYAVSVTGVAGPTGGRSGLPIGTFYIGVAGPDGLEVAERIHTDADDRDGNKRQATQAVIDLLGREMGI